MDNQSMETIYSSIFSHFMSANCPNVKDITDSLVKSSISIYSAVRAALL